MKLTKVLMAIVLVTTISFVSCKPKTDADLKAVIEEKMKTIPGITGFTVVVKDGVANIEGMCMNDTCKISCEKLISEIEGVKSVINNCTVVPPPPPPPLLNPAPPPPPIDSVTIGIDEATQLQIKDGLKGYPGVTVVFSGDKVILSGRVTKANRKKIIKVVTAANVKYDARKLKIKK